MGEQLIYGKKTDGKYYVRSVDWAGVWDKDGNLDSGNTLYEFDTEQECIKCIETGQVFVYKMNDYEWWASKLSIEETEDFIEKEIGGENDLDDIEECDIDSEGMWWQTEEKEDLDKLGDADDLIDYEIISGQTRRKVSFGNLMRRDGEVFKYIPFRIALMKSGEYVEPFCIASTEW